MDILEGFGGGHRGTPCVASCLGFDGQPLPVGAGEVLGEPGEDWVVVGGERGLATSFRVWEV